jgi:ABC-2 type transport system permease protein
MLVIARRDFYAHFRSLSNNLFLFMYFITGAVFWAVSLGRLVAVPSYFQFLVVGLAVLGIYNTSFNYMNVVSTEVRRGYMKYLLALPVSRGGLTVGRVLAGASQGIVYVAILLAIAVTMIGVPTLIGALTILSTVVALSICLSSLGIAIATHFRPEMIDPMSDILGLALIFTSTLYYPQNLMPEPMRIITVGNVLSAGANLMRAGFGLQQVSLQDLGTLLVWTLVLGILSVQGYYRQLKELA